MSEICSYCFRPHKAEAVKAGKSSIKSADRQVRSSSDTTQPAEMDSCMIVNDETIVGDQLTSAADRSLHAAPKPSVSGNIMTDNASSRAVAENSDATETTARSTSRLFDLVNADSPVAQVS